MSKLNDVANYLKDWNAKNLDDFHAGGERRTWAVMNRLFAVALLGGLLYGATQIVFGIFQDQIVDAACDAGLIKPDVCAFHDLEVEWRGKPVVFVSCCEANTPACGCVRVVNRTDALKHGGAVPWEFWTGFNRSNSTPLNNS